GADVDRWYPATAMTESLCTHESLDHELMWRYMRRLLDRIFGVLESDTVVDDCLDILVDVLGADRGLILLTFADGSTHAVNARGHKKTLSAVEREEISKTIIREALVTGACVEWLPMMSSARPSASMATLGIAAALAAPLHSGDAARRGVLYVDF